MATATMEKHRDATPEKIWAILMETADRQAEHDRRHKEWEERFEREKAEADKRFEKEKAEADKRFQQEKAETDRRMREADLRLEKVTKNVGGLNRSLGELIETLLAAHLWEKFAHLPYGLERAYQRVPVYGEKNEGGGKRKILTDIDILLADTEWVMLVEVKREFSDREDVDHHVRRMALVRKHPPAEVVGKKMLGAIAGGVVTPDVREYAHEKGFFVLELAGEAVDLIPPPEGFEPREW